MNDQLGSGSQLGDLGIGEALAGLGVNSTLPRILRGKGGISAWMAPPLIVAGS
jgi:hypothetical protein